VNRANKILVLTSTFPRWKQDKDPPFVFELCRRLSSFFQVTVSTPAFPKSRREEVVEGVRVLRFRYFFAPLERLAYGRGGGILQRIRQKPAYGLLVPFFLVGQMMAAARLLRKEKFDLIHAHWLIPQGLIAVLARALSGRRIPILATSHGGDLYGLQGHLMNRLRAMVIQNAAAVTVVSSAMRKDLLKSGASSAKISVIPMGTDLVERFRPGVGRRDPGRVLFVGRLVEKKGCRYLVEAWPEVRVHHKDAMLTIVGDGPERPRLQKRCQTLGVEGSVTFAGSVPQASLPTLYRVSGVVVFPSVVAKGGDREGFGLVLVEALGCECAAVVTDLPAMRDIVEDGKSALVVPQKSSKALAREIVRLLDDPALARRLGRNGRRHVLANFDWSQVAALYRRLIDFHICDAKHDGISSNR
jgi:glycosyltransferase involved in cell wall biosynthesis